MERRDPLRWMRENLFNSWYNSLLTLLMAWIIFTIVRSALPWMIGTARWDVITANMQILLVGVYPRTEVWRIWLACISLLVLAVVSIIYFSRPRSGKRWTPWLLGAWFLSFPWIMFLLWGGLSTEWLPRVETSSWGGLTLTLVLAMVGIACSFPIAVLLALGRRSSLSVISVVCTVLIEVVRGTPLVAVLFMAHLMVPIFLPDFRIDKVVRAMIGLTIFTGAYMAENVRGGLQSVPKGQYEAARALGMNGTLTMLLVILPQALRAVIPSMVGQFISLFKDTSLVAIIGLLDLLGIAKGITANPAWLGLHAEVYLFVAVVYWIFCFALSRASRRVERMLGLADSPS